MAVVAARSIKPPNIGFEGSLSCRTRNLACVLLGPATVGSSLLFENFLVGGLCDLFNRGRQWFRGCQGRCTSSYVEAFPEFKNTGFLVETIVCQVKGDLELPLFFFKTGPDYSSRPTIVYFTCCAATPQGLYSTVRRLIKGCGCNVILPIYRGGLPGLGSRDMIANLDDTLNMFKVIYKRSDINKDKLFLCGSVLGSHQVLNIAVNNPGKIKGIILDGAFKSYGSYIHNARGLFGACLRPFIGMGTPKPCNLIQQLPDSLPIFFMFPWGENALFRKEYVDFADLAKAKYQVRLFVHHGRQFNNIKTGGHVLVAALREFMSNVCHEPGLVTMKVYQSNIHNFYKVKEKRGDHIAILKNALQNLEFAKQHDNEPREEHEPGLEEGLKAELRKVQKGQNELSWEGDTLPTI